MIDLHVHTTASDGVKSPSEVVEYAKKIGIKALAITDHDTLDGIAEARQAGDRLGVRVVAGCEFSVAVSWGELHLLGYFLPEDDETLAGMFRHQRESRAERAAKMIQRLEAYGAPPLEETVLKFAAGAPIGRPHIARALVELGWISSVQDAFVEYLADGAPAYMPKELPALADVVSLIRELNGVTSAAHLKGRATEAVIRDLHTMGVDALEVVHPTHQKQHKDQLTAMAEKFGMLKTGGSDWHGDEQRSRQLGNPEVPVEWLDQVEACHLDRLDA